MIKAVLFDLDGTLLDTNELIYKSFNYILNERLNMNIPKEDITKLYGEPIETSLKRFFSNEEDIINTIKEYRKYNLEHHDNMCKAFDGVIELLKSLKSKNIKIAIVTSKRKDMAMRGLKISNILEYVDVIMSPEDTDKHKPDPQPAIRACEKLNVKPEEAIMVGDSSYDLLCGKDAGCLTCGVSYTVVDINRLLDTKPTYMIKYPTELLQVLFSMEEK